jgi:DNA-binding winged helix-turn-helix (wHTH) protein
MILKFKDLQLDTEAECVRRDGDIIELGELSFRVLRHLFESGGQRVTFDELMDAIWAPAVVNEETVTQRIRLLRKALGDNAREPRYIASVRGRGYRLCGNAIATAQPDRQASSTRRPARVWGAVAAVSIVLAALSVAWWLQGNSTAISPPTLYERAEHYRTQGQESSLLYAITLFQQRLEEVPGNARATVGLSLALSARVCRYQAPLEDAQQALHLANQALNQQADNATAAHAKAYALDCLGSIDEAIASYQRALELAPDSSRSQSALAYLLSEKGDLANALLLNLDVAQRDPQQSFSQLQLARNYELLDYSLVAEQLYARSYQLYPDNVFSNAAYPCFLLRHGRLAEARALFERATGRTSHPDAMVCRAELALMENDRTSAISIFDAIDDQANHHLQALAAVIRGDDPLTPHWEALRGLTKSGPDLPRHWLMASIVANTLDEQETALKLLEQAIEAGFLDDDWLRTTPFLADLRNQPGFIALIDQIGQKVKAEREALPPQVKPALAAPLALID